MDKKNKNRIKIKMKKIIKKTKFNKKNKNKKIDYKTF